MKMQRLLRLLRLLRPAKSKSAFCPRHQLDYIFCAVCLRFRTLWRKKIEHGRLRCVPSGWKKMWHGWVFDLWRGSQKLTPPWTWIRDLRGSPDLDKSSWVFKHRIQKHGAWVLFWLDCVCQNASCSNFIFISMEKPCEQSSWNVLPMQLFPSLFGVISQHLRRLYRILRKGTSKGYASVAFSPHNKAKAMGCRCLCEAFKFRLTKRGG